MIPDQESPRAGVGVGVWLVLATAVVSGISTFVNLYAVKGTNSDAFVTVRNSLVALMLVPIAVLSARWGRDRLRPFDVGRLAVIGVVGGAIPFLLFFHGLQLAGVGAGASSASFVYRTLFVFASVLGIVVLRERAHPRAALAGALLLGGNLLLLSLTDPTWNVGTLFVLAATVLWAVEYTLSKRVLADLSAGTVALGRMGFGSLVLLGYVGATGQISSAVGFTGIQWQWIGLSSVLLLGFVATWYAGLRRVDLGVATSVLVLGYPVTWALALLLRGSALTAGGAFGASLVAAGVVAAVGLPLWREAAGVARRAILGRPADGR